MASQANTPRDNPSTTPPSTDQKSCWECSRRRLVCDETHPTCRKCSDVGIVCPGYSNAKPLRWLAPGRVNARIRRKPRRKAEGKGEGAAAKGGKGAKTKTTLPALPVRHRDNGSASTAPSALSSTGFLTGSTDVALSSLPSEPGTSSEEVADVELVRPTEGGGALTWDTWGVPQAVSRYIFASEETEIVQATYYCMPSHPPPRESWPRHPHVSALLSLPIRAKKGTDVTQTTAPSTPRSPPTSSSPQGSSAPSPST